MPTTQHRPTIRRLQSIGQDIAHSWEVAHAAYDYGKMDGFVKAEGRNLIMATTIDQTYHTTETMRIATF